MFCRAWPESHSALCEAPPIRIDGQPAATAPQTRFAAAESPVACGSQPLSALKNLEILDFEHFAASLPANCGPDAGPAFPIPDIEGLHMAKAVTIKVKLVSSADTGFYYVAKKNSRTMTDKLVKKKYDPVARKHVEFREAKIK
jgi:large subunit ribosomal protein L33